jgi:hypothetical protein
MTDTFSFPKTLAGGMPPLSGFPTSPPHRRRHDEGGGTRSITHPPPPPAPAAAAALASKAAVTPCCIAAAPPPRRFSCGGGGGGVAAVALPNYAAASPSPCVSRPRRFSCGGGGAGVAADHPPLAAWGAALRRRRLRVRLCLNRQTTAASLITPDREGGTADNNRGPSKLDFGDIAIYGPGVGHTPSTTSVRSSPLPSSPAQEGILTFKSSIRKCVI